MKTWIVGSDEAGFGTWAGDLIVAAVAVPSDWSDSAVKDSKQMGNHDHRVAAVQKYKNHEEVLWTLHRTPPDQIDSVGLRESCIRAHIEVHAQLRNRLRARDVTDPRHIVDGFENASARFRAQGIMPLNKADTKVPAVSLASCFAKVAQCQLMDRLHEQYPLYGFNSHRGYHAPAHVQALETHGVLPVHRKSYGPIKRLLNRPPPLSEFYEM